MGSGASATDSNELYLCGKCSFCGEVKKVTRAAAGKPLFCAHCILYGNKQAGVDSIDMQSKQTQGEVKARKGTSKHATPLGTCSSCGEKRKTTFFQDKQLCIACSLDWETPRNRRHRDDHFKSQTQKRTRVPSRKAGKHDKTLADKDGVQTMHARQVSEKSARRHRNDSSVAKLPPIFQNASRRSTMANGVSKTRDAVESRPVRKLQRSSSDVSIEVLSEPLLRASLTTCSLVTGNDQEVLTDLAYQMVAEQSGVQRNIAKPSDLLRSFTAKLVRGIGISEQFLGVRQNTFPEDRPKGAEIRSGSLPAPLKATSPSNGGKKSRRSLTSTRANYAMTSLATNKHLS